MKNKKNNLYITHSANLFFTLTLTLGLIFSSPLLAKVLSENDVLNLTYQNTPQGQSLELEKKLAEEAIRKAKSQYDTLLSAGASHVFDQSAKSSVIMGDENQNTNFNLSLTQNTPLGTRFSLTTNTTRQKTNSTFVSAQELYEPEFAVSLSQPLLNNGWGVQNRGRLQTTEAQSQSQVQTANQELNNLALRNVTLYWNWFFLNQAHKLSGESVNLAQKLVDVNSRKKSLGLIEQSELSAFRANLQIKKADHITTQMNLENTENTLKSQLNLNDDITFNSDNIAPPQTPVEKESLQYALEHNPQLLSLKSQLTAQNIALSVYKNARLPQLDLQGSLALNGIDTKMNTALSDVSSPHPQWMAGVGLSFPLQNRSARSDYKTSTLKKQQLLYRLQDEENRILAEVKSLCTNILNLKQKVKIVAEALEHQKLKWQAEEIKYNQGRSDPDFVINAQNDYIQTQMLYWKSKTDLKIEQAKYLAILGKLKPEQK